MASYTTNYGLHQWKATDNFLRTDFNADFEKIDEALGTKPELVSGSYTGDGTASRTIPLDFTPKALYLCTETGQAYDSSNGSSTSYGGLVLPGGAVAVREHTVAEIVEGGLQVGHWHEDTGSFYRTYSGNAANTVYRYLAVK